MASSITTPASAASSTPTFSGQSSFASSLGQVLTKAVEVASLPMQLLQADVNTLQSQQTALNSLETVFNTLQNDVIALNSAAQGVPTASTSSPGTVTATASAGAQSGTYSITVDRIGSAATALSNAGTSAITDPTQQNISSSSTYTLTIDGKSYSPISLSTNSLQALAQAINESGAPVSATIVNVGGSSSDYRLALTSTNFSAQQIQLSDGSNNLVTTLNGGTTAQYRVTGSKAEINADSNQVTLAPGVTVDMLQNSSNPVSVTVSNSYSGLSDALSSFANDYNAAFDAVSQNIGQNGGALAGQSIIREMSGVLSSLAQYTASSGSASSFTDLGLDLDQTGHLTFDSTAFSNANTADIQQFLGQISSSGFLQMANSAISSVTDSSTGMVHLSFSVLQNEVDSDNAEISTDQDRVNQLQTTLTTQLSAADAAIASLESQKNYMLQLFQAEYPATSD